VLQSSQAAAPSNDGAPKRVQLIVLDKVKQMAAAALGQKEFPQPRVNVSNFVVG